MIALLIEGAARVTFSVILIIGAAKKEVELLTIFLVAWSLMFILVLGDLIFSIAVSVFLAKARDFELSFSPPPSWNFSSTLGNKPQLYV